MVDAIISAVVKQLTSIVFSSIKEEVELLTGVNDEVKNLVNNFKSIQSLLDDAEEQQLKEASVKNWLFNLKTVSYDMDDVLDEWKTWIQTSQLQSSDPIALKDKVLSIFCCNCFTVRDVGFRHVIGGRIKEIHQILDNIAADNVRYQLNSTNKSDKHIERHVTTSFVETQRVKGRDVEKASVKSRILAATSDRLRIMALVGLGGIGKTTLAKLIYNDSEIQTHFDKMVWVWVSVPFDEMRIAKAILESLDRSSSTLDLKELNNVVEEIRAVLNNKRFLLVLDDVWNESRSKWEELEQSLRCGLEGSTILVTTRSERVAINMGCNYHTFHGNIIYKLQILTLEQCWSIISQITLVQGDGMDNQRMKSIGERIAKKCKGLPLAANIVGGLLCFKRSENEWLEVLEKMKWEYGSVLNNLELSYYDLPLPLKQCFKYCAIFPKGSKNKKEKLIRMWMAQGYISGKEADLEREGETYFNNLIARSLLQILYFKNENRRFVRTWITQGSLRGKENMEEDLGIATKAHFHNWMARTLLLSLSDDFDDDWFILHDIVSDLAQKFAEDECLMIEVSNDTRFNENSLHSNANARHLTLVMEEDASFPVFIYSLNKLRSLIIQFFGYESSLTVDAVKDIFDYLTCLRALDLSKCGIKEVPSSINRLVHLRWLDLSENRNLKELPETLYDCYNLQTLILFNCETLIELPQGIGKLINLMFLDIRNCYNIKYLPKGIGDLLCLKELRDFIVGGVYDVYENNTFCIGEMKKLNNLRGSLVIRGLGNVVEIEDVRAAHLMKKIKVTDLGLIFDGDDVQENEEALLEALQPPSDLEILRLEEYKGKKLFPSWMVKLNRLRYLEISTCFGCEELPPLGKLLHLEELYLKNMGVKKVGVEFMGIENEKYLFPELKILEFDGFLEWEEWDDIDEELMETIKVMPSLQQIGISNCSKLTTLPYRLLSRTITPRLQRLYINANCHALRQIEEHELSHIPDLCAPWLSQAEQEGEEDEEE